MTPRPSVDLRGLALAGVVHAISATATRTGLPVVVVVVGGVAVLFRLSGPYRTTSDLDAVDRRSAGHPGRLELLLASGAQPSGPSGALIPTPVGLVQVDVLEVSDADLATLPDDPTVRLYVLSHAWAAASATEMDLRADGVEHLAVSVAAPGPLVAIKLQSAMNRGTPKEGSDLLDIVRLVLDPLTGPWARDALRKAEPRLRSDALLHARRWFGEQVERSLRLVRTVPEGRETERDDLALVAELLENVLGGHGLA